MKRCSSSSDSDTSSDDDAVAADKKRKEEEDLWHLLPFWMDAMDAVDSDDEPMDIYSELDGDSTDYDMYEEAADHATWVEWAQREKEKRVGVFFNNNNNMG